MHDTLLQIQAELKAPKGQYNNFGKYHYRSCEDIVEAVKPLCVKYKAVLTLSDKVEAVGNRNYVVATATLTDLQGKSVAVTAYAREEETKKGMDGAQITGAASSYARKYALNGLFAIDDTKDADATNDHGQPGLSTVFTEQALLKLSACASLEQLATVWKSLPATLQKDAEVVAMKDEMKGKLQ